MQVGVYRKQYINGVSSSQQWARSDIAVRVPFRNPVHSGVDAWMLATMPPVAGFGLDLKMPCQFVLSGQNSPSIALQSAEGQIPGAPWRQQFVSRCTAMNMPQLTARYI